MIELVLCALWVLVSIVLLFNRYAQLNPLWFVSLCWSLFVLASLLAKGTPQ